MKVDCALRALGGGVATALVFAMVDSSLRDAGRRIALVANQDQARVVQLGECDWGADVEAWGEELSGSWQSLAGGPLPERGWKINRGKTTRRW